MVEISYCGFCRNFIKMGEDKSTVYCKAFPDGKKGFVSKPGENCTKDIGFNPTEKARKILGKKFDL